jgi:hypothetical protein
MNEERRRSPRHQLIADAEIVELRSNRKLRARSSDVSLVGCFMNASHLFPQGTKVQLTLRQQETSFTSLGVVARAQPMGMGVSFSDVRLDQREVLQKWLEEAS